MTREQATELGFKFTGRLGLARVYISDPREQGEVQCAARGLFSEFIMDLQEAIDALLMFMGSPRDLFVFRIDKHIDGTPLKESDL